MIKYSYNQKEPNQIARALWNTIICSLKRLQEKGIYKKAEIKDHHTTILTPDNDDLAEFKQIEVLLKEGFINKEIV